MSTHATPSFCGVEFFSKKKGKKEGAALVKMKELITFILHCLRLRKNHKSQSYFWSHDHHTMTFIKTLLCLRLRLLKID